MRQLVRVLRHEERLCVFGSPETKNVSVTHINTDCCIILTALIRRLSQCCIQIPFVALLHRKHVLVATIGWLTLFKEVVAVYGENRMKPISALWGGGGNAELVSVKAGGTYSYHCTLNC
jgi:hypothetical protein